MSNKSTNGNIFACPVSLHGVFLAPVLFPWLPSDHSYVWMKPMQPASTIIFKAAALMKPTAFLFSSAPYPSPHLGLLSVQWKSCLTIYHISVYCWSGEFSVVHEWPQGINRTRRDVLLDAWDFQSEELCWEHEGTAQLWAPQMKTVLTPSTFPHVSWCQQQICVSADLGNDDLAKLDSWLNASLICFHYINEESQLSGSLSFLRCKHSL